MIIVIGFVIVIIREIFKSFAPKLLANIYNFFFNLLCSKARINLCQNMDLSSR